MCCALYQCLVEIKKLVLLPLKAGTGMRALVVKSKEFTILVYDKNSSGLAPDFEFETFAAGVFDIRGFAENVGHVVW